MMTHVIPSHRVSCPAVARSSFCSTWSSYGWFCPGPAFRPHVFPISPAFRPIVACRARPCRAHLDRRVHARHVTPFHCLRVRLSLGVCVSSPRVDVLWRVLLSPRCEDLTFGSFLRPVCAGRALSASRFPCTFPAALACPSPSSSHCNCVPPAALCFSPLLHAFAFGPLVRRQRSMWLALPVRAALRVVGCPRYPAASFHSLSFYWFC